MQPQRWGLQPHLWGYIFFLQPHLRGWHYFTMNSTTKYINWYAFNFILPRWKQRKHWQHRSRRRTLRKGWFIHPSRTSEKYLLTLLLMWQLKHMSSVRLYFRLSTFDYWAHLFKIGFEIILSFHVLLYLFFSGLATKLPRPENLVKYAESCMYTPVYRSYR